MTDDLTCRIFALCIATLVVLAFGLGLWLGARYNPLHTRAHVKKKAAEVLKFTFHKKGEKQ